MAHRALRAAQGIQAAALARGAVDEARSGAHEPRQRVGGRARRARPLHPGSRAVGVRAHPAARARAGRRRTVGLSSRPRGCGVRRHAGLIGVGLLALAACTTSACVAGEADPTNTSAEPSSGPAALMPGEPLTDDEAAAFGAVAALDSAAACVGTLVDTGVPTGPAYLLTAGRCVGGLGQPPQSTALMLEWSSTADFLRTAAVQGRGIPVEVVELTYATMRNADVGIIRLGSTLAEVEALGIASLPIAVEQPTSGEAVASIGIPVLGLQPDAQVLRARRVHPGSPALADRVVLAVDRGLRSRLPRSRCGRKRLAAARSGRERHPGGGRRDGHRTAVGNEPRLGLLRAQTPLRGHRSGRGSGRGNRAPPQSVAGIGRCFDETTGVVLTGRRMPVARVGRLGRAGQGACSSQARSPMPTDASPKPASSVRVSGCSVPRPSRFGNGEGCLDGDTYADAETHVLPRQGQPWEAVGVVVTPQLPGEEGHYLLCAVSGEGYDLAASVIFEVDRTPPTLAADAEVERLEGGGVAVRPLLRPPELRPCDSPGVRRVPSTARTRTHCRISPSLRSPSRRPTCRRSTASLGWMPRATARRSRASRSRAPDEPPLTVDR